MPGAGGGEAPRLTVFGETYAHVRHRVYFSALGRWGQADPNASGTTLIGNEAHHGEAIAVLVDAFDFERRMGDGANLHAYLGSNPWTRSDPLGLFYGEYALEGGFAIGKTLFELSSQYAENQEHDALWSDDFTLSDGWSTREDASWVAEILSRNVEEYLNDRLGLAGHLVQGGKARYTMLLGRTMSRVNVRMHHVLPQYLARALGKQSKVLGEIPLDLHQKYHRRLDVALRRIGMPPMNTRDQERLREWVDNGDDKRSQDVINIIKQETANFGREHKLEGLMPALRAAFRIADP